MNKILIGFSAGLLVGILFAPAKGSHTRESIAQKGRDLKEKFDDIVDSLTDQFGALKDDAEDLMDDSKRQAQTLSAEARSSY